MTVRTPREADDSPQELAAREFMAAKGFLDARPFQVDEVEGQLCWYYLFQLPEGVLELEVEYTAERGWNVCVMDFIDRPR